MDDEETELRNPFPSPPSHYTRYTTHNLKLLGLLKDRADPEAELGSLNQYEVLADQTDVPEWSLAQLEKPRVDWILEEGHYTVFGDSWFVSTVSGVLQKPCRTYNTVLTTPPRAARLRKPSPHSPSSAGINYTHRTLVLVRTHIPPSHLTNIKPELPNIYTVYHQTAAPRSASSFAQCLSPTPSSLARCSHHLPRARLKSNPNGSSTLSGSTFSRRTSWPPRTTSAPSRRAATSNS